MLTWFFSILSVIVFIVLLFINRYISICPSCHCCYYLYSARFFFICCCSHCGRLFLHCILRSSLKLLSIVSIFYLYHWYPSVVVVIVFFLLFLVAPALLFFYIVISIDYHCYYCILSCLPEVVVLFGCGCCCYSKIEVFLLYFICCSIIVDIVIDSSGKVGSLEIMDLCINRNSSGKTWIGLDAMTWVSKHDIKLGLYFSSSNSLSPFFSKDSRLI